MVQVNGIREPEQRFNTDRTGRVKYSTSCPWRTLLPWAARRAMPTRRWPESGSKGRVSMVFRLLFAIILRPARRSIIVVSRGILRVLLGEGSFVLQRKADFQRR